MASTSVKSTSIRRRYLPYRYARHGLEFAVSGFSTDDGERITEFDTERRLIALEEHRGWESVTIEGTVSLVDSLLETVVPPTEQQTPPIALLIAVRCRSTHLRERYSVADAPLETESYPVKIELPRRYLRDVVELTPYLARTAPTDVDSNEFATFEGAQLASCRPWEVRVDIRDGPSGNHLDIEYHRFSQKEHLPGPEQVYYLDLHKHPREPLLYLNNDHDKIVNALDSEGTWGAEARAREVFFDQIAQSVWTQLFVHAGTDIDEDGDVRYDWEESVLDRFLPDVYPELDENAARKQLSEDLASDDELSEVLARIDRTLQRDLDLRKHMTDLVEDALE